jgi:hypothetical protein
MIRTQVSLDEYEYQIAEREAQARGISVAEFFRRAIRQALVANSEKPWMRYAGFVASGDPKSSQSIDDVVYGAKEVPRPETNLGRCSRIVADE